LKYCSHCADALSEYERRAWLKSQPARVAMVEARRPYVGF